MMGRRLVAILTAAVVLGSAAETSRPLPQESFWKIYTDALRGDCAAQYQAGVIFERGIGVDRNESMAAVWYEKAARQGYVDAQYNIAIMYAAGRGVERNDAMAMMWFALAAREGDAEARQLLLQMIDGKGDAPKPKGAVTEQEIAPVTLIVKADGEICPLDTGSGGCTRYKAGTVLTSHIRHAGRYKVTGIVLNGQWREYREEGWIDERDVEIRR